MRAPPCLPQYPQVQAPEHWSGRQTVVLEHTGPPHQCDQRGVFSINHSPMTSVRKGVAVYFTGKCDILLPGRATDMPSWVVCLFPLGVRVPAARAPKRTLILRRNGEDPDRLGAGHAGHLTDSGGAVRPVVPAGVVAPVNVVGHRGHGRRSGRRAAGTLNEYVNSPASFIGDVASTIFTPAASVTVT